MKAAVLSQKRDNTDNRIAVLIKQIDGLAKKNLEYSNPDSFRLQDITQSFFMHDKAIYQNCKPMLEILEKENNELLEKQRMDSKKNAAQVFKRSLIKLNAIRNFKPADPSTPRENPMFSATFQSRARLMEMEQLRRSKTMNSINEGVLLSDRKGGASSRKHL